MHGAAGGVGLAAVDLGIHYGAKVIATSASSSKREFLSSYGAHHVLPDSGFKDKVKELTPATGQILFMTLSEAMYLMSLFDVLLGMVVY